MNEADLMSRADQLAADYARSASIRPPYPSSEAIASLAAFDEPFPEIGRTGIETLELLDRVGSPATAVTTGPRYFGYVVGGVLPAAAAAERMVIAWDQRASTFASSPVAAAIERVAARWIVEILDLPKLIAAVNHKPRVYKPRVAKTARDPNATTSR